jgi:hypothetical protein
MRSVAMLRSFGEVHRLVGGAKRLKLRARRASRSTDQISQKRRQTSVELLFVLLIANLNVFLSFLMGIKRNGS